MLPEIERQQEMGKEVAFRADAAFAKPEIYEALQARQVKYAIRIPANHSAAKLDSVSETLPIWKLTRLTFALLLATMRAPSEVA